MHRFFVDQEQIGNDAVRITGADVNHIRNVLRLRTGDEILVVARGDEDAWEYTCRISEADPERILAAITDAQRPGRELPSRMFLLQALPKADKMDLVIQKAVELGVYAVIPVVTERCVVRLDEKKAEKRILRWNRIAESAAKQARRSRVPEVTRPLTLTEALAKIESASAEVRLIPYEHETDMNETRRRLGGVRPGMDVAVLIGPEGGFAKTEVEEARASGFAPVSLGSRILRTETAGLCLLSALMLQIDPGN